MINAHRLVIVGIALVLAVIAGRTDSAQQVVNSIVATSCSASNWVTGISATGAATCAQPAAANVSGLATSATTDTTNASNIASGTLAAARGGAGTVTGALRGNGAGAVTQAACADISNAAASCATDATNATNIGGGTLAAARMAAFGSGDVSFAAAGGAGTIAANAVTNAKAAQMTFGSVKGRVTAGTGNAEDIAAGQLPATATNDNASAGRVGEFGGANAGATALTTTIPANVHSVSLTAGDWDVSGAARFFPSASTQVTAVEISISTTSNTRDTSADRLSSFSWSTPLIGDGLTIVTTLTTPITRLNLSATTTVYLVGLSLFTVSNMAANSNYIYARRVR